MSSVGFEPTIPAFEWAKSVHALDRAATVIGHTDTVYTWKKTGEVEHERKMLTTNATYKAGEQDRPVGDNTSLISEQGLLTNRSLLYETAKERNDWSEATQHELSIRAGTTLTLPYRQFI
jgi:hypothetical protein